MCPVYSLQVFIMKQICRLLLFPHPMFFLELDGWVMWRRHTYPYRVFVSAKSLQLKLCAVTSSSIFWKLINAKPLSYLNTLANNTQGDWRTLAASWFKLLGVFLFWMTWWVPFQVGRSVTFEFPEFSIDLRLEHFSGVFSLLFLFKKNKLTLLWGLLVTHS